MFQTGTVRESDTILITSYLGRNPGWDKVFRKYSSEFLVLGISTFAQKRSVYRRSHPSFTLFRALSEVNLQSEIALRCFGCIEYHDSSSMGLYGYLVDGGITTFSPFVRNYPYFNIKSGCISEYIFERA